jgi:hypothetical protein
MCVFALLGICLMKNFNFDAIDYYAKSLHAGEFFFCD